MKFIDLFSFSGRAGREEFAAVSLLLQAVSFMLSLVGLFILFNGAEITLIKAMVLLVLGLLMIPVSVFLLWIALALFFRRLHDFNLSGGWYIGYLVFIMALAVFFPGLQWATTLLGIVLIAFLSVKRAPAAANRFAEGAAPFFPQLFTARPWLLWVIVAVTAVLALLPLLMLNFAR